MLLSRRTVRQFARLFLATFWLIAIMLLSNLLMFVWLQRIHVCTTTGTLNIYCSTCHCYYLFKPVVRVTGLEPARLAAPEPKSGATTNFATPALVRPDRIELP